MCEACSDAGGDNPVTEELVIRDKGCSGVL